MRSLAAAQCAALLYNTNRKKGAKAMKAEDFIGKCSQRKKPTPDKDIGWIKQDAKDKGLWVPD
jgi:hypothetical protein